MAVGSGSAFGPFAWFISFVMCLEAGPAAESQQATAPSPMILVPNDGTFASDSLA